MTLSRDFPVPGCVRARPFSSGGEGSEGGGTQLGGYLERCGAIWGDAADVHEVQVSEDGLNFAWRIDLPIERLEALQCGEPLQSPPFALGPRSQGRFQVFPKGDAGTVSDGKAAVWLWTDCGSEELSALCGSGGKPLLQVGSCEREGGSSEFCAIEDAVVDGVLHVNLRLQQPPPKEEVVSAISQSVTTPASTHQTAAEASPHVQQSLQLTGLESAEWKIFGLGDVIKSGELMTSPPFRFHHVLLGDMYLELLPGDSHPELCTLFFRCRVPTMKLRVSLQVGDAFSKSFVSQGRHTYNEDLQSGQCLQVNVGAPDVVGPDGSLMVQCALEEVEAIPRQLKDMIPRLDERALWPKRL